MIAAIAKGTSRISNFANSSDCAATLSCLTQVGVAIERNKDDVLVHGAGLRGLRQPDAPLDCGNSGTTMRLLAGILAGQEFKSTLTGDASLRSRPMQRIIEPLTMMGAIINSDDGHAPLTITGQRFLKAISYDLLVASAQVKSCILFAGLNAKGCTEVTEEFITRDHTERMLNHFRVPVETSAGTREGSQITSVKGPASFRAHFSGRAGYLSIPGDISSAGYFLAAAAL